MSRLIHNYNSNECICCAILVIVVIWCAYILYNYSHLYSTTTTKIVFELNWTRAFRTVFFYLIGRRICKNRSSENFQLYFYAKINRMKKLKTVFFSLWFCSSRLLSKNTVFSDFKAAFLHCKQRWFIAFMFSVWMQLQAQRLSAYCIRIARLIEAAVSVNHMRIFL